MAVVQVTFRHHRVAWETQRILHPKQETFTHQLRRVAAHDACEWSSAEEVLIDWGDPACRIDPEALLQDCRNNAAQPYFGRSWIYYHRPTHQLMLAVDCLGMFPILLSQHGRHSYLASDTLALSQLLNTAATADTSALLELLAYGQLLGSQTTLSEALHLQAGTIYEVDASGCLSVKQGTDFGQIDAQPSTAEDTLEQLYYAIARRLEANPNCAVSFSGKPIDYLLLALIQAAGGNPVILGSGFADNRHLDNINTLAGITGGKFYSDVFSTTRLISARKAFAQLGSGEAPLSEDHLMLYPDLITHTRNMTLFSSSGASLLPGPMPVVQNGAAPQTALRGLFDKYLQPFTTAFPELSTALSNRLDTRLEFYRYATKASTDTLLNRVYLNEYFRRTETAREQLLSRDYARSYPLLDQPVLCALLGLPYALKQQGQFYDWAIRRLNPDIADLAAHANTAMLSSKRQANELSDYTCWLNTLHNETQPLRLALQACDLPEKDIRQGTDRLLQGPTRYHTLSVLAVYSDWLRYLAAQRAARVAV